MPQLNPEFFVSQLFWLIVTFSFLLFFLWKISLPRISRVLEKRENKINNDIEIAKKLQAEAELIQNEIDRQLSNARDQANNIINESTRNLKNTTAIELAKIDNELSKKIDESSAIIRRNKKESIKKISNQILEITKLTISKLSFVPVTDKEINDSVTKIQSRPIL
jgi:F-type H+-transporting ATPase subunit b